MDEKIEVVNKTLTTLLHSVIKMNLKNQEGCLPFIEFAYNCSEHSTTDFSPFEIIYSFNPLTPLDLILLTVDENVSFDENIKAQMMKVLHESIQKHIEKKND